MAFTLEASIAIPVTMILATGIISSSITLYEMIDKESVIESQSLIYPIENKELWSCRINPNKENTGWSKMLAVNPMKEKTFFNFIIDTANELKELIPALNEMEELFFENKQ